ncbi:hypothetical protein LZC95_50210 [Pendulispora brunnea]|uniref:Uncharacterized protein n=1 Tax=Pendulispora brunnea TaxID=2905690 RepID=A0ABZ2KBW5_9BACT
MMAGFADEDEELWSSISLNSVVFENLPVEADGDGIANKLDVKDGEGTDGGVVTPRGSSPRKFSLTLGLWTAEHRRAFEAVLPLIGARAGKTRTQPVVVTYPALNMCGITRAWIERASIPKGDGKGIFELQLECVEALPPKPAAKKTANAAGAKGSGAVADGNRARPADLPVSLLRNDLIPPRVPNIEP